MDVKYYAQLGADAASKKLLGKGIMKIIRVASFGGNTENQTFNCTNIPNYTELSVNNFANIVNSGWGGTYGTRHANFQISPSLSYNAANGILTLSPTESKNKYNDRVSVGGYINCYYVDFG